MATATATRCGRGKGRGYGNRYGHGNPLRTWQRNRHGSNGNETS
jgi:ribosomal protein L15